MTEEPKEADEITQEGDDDVALPPKQELALRAIAVSPTLKEAARAAGVSDATLWRYMQEPAFKRRLRNARREAVSHALIRMQRASGEAVTVLEELMRSEKASASARISAARAIIDYSMRAVEMDELQSRIDELEEFILRKQEEDALDRGLKAAGDEDEDDD
jgi:molybdenum-dependent DNA-binding transcriptional regulator ModE